MVIRVMTWNLWWRFGDWERRERAIVDTIREVDPDILCLQETWASRTARGEVELQAHRLAAQLDMEAVVNDPVWFEDQSFCNAVLSRWPLQRRVDAALPRADGQLGYRRVVGAVARTPWGAWPVLSTHLDHRFDGSATRTLQMFEVLAHMSELRGDPTSDLPAILGADLNAVPDSDEIRTATGRRAGGPEGIVVSDAWDQVGQGPGVTWSRGNPDIADSAWPDRRIDYVMVSWPRPKPVGNPVRAWVVGDCPVPVDDELVWPSDHAAVVAELCTPI
jgi:endonuclease/exonuclease/phosphatase family metal-dependent hydrolase